jgi:hypothetical protein
LEPSKLPAEADGGVLDNWVRFFKAETKEELIMAGQTDPAIKEAVGLVMEVNADERRWARADSRLKWQMDQADRERESYSEGLAEGRKEAEAAYRVIEERDQKLTEKIREVEELRRKLREAGIDN